MASITSSFSIRLMFVVLLIVIGVGNADLNANFYSKSCPGLNDIIRNAVKTAVSNEARMGASLLRLHFHDCFVNGCDGSVLLNDTTNFIGEKSAGPNLNSLRGFNVIDTIKTQVEAACPDIVSCADIVAVAARDGVVELNGPYWEVPLGRRDSTTASLSDANTQIPAPTFELKDLITAFTNKGFDAGEMVALSGGHTIGQARCTTFRNRIYNETNINAPFAASVRTRCPTSTSGDNNLSPLDIISPTKFNNDYFKDLVSLKGLLHSDQQLTNGTTNARVVAYSYNYNNFKNDFVAAMIKMSKLSPLTGTNGQIRKFCWKINS